MTVPKYRAINPVMVRVPAWSIEAYSQAPILDLNEVMSREDFRNALFASSSTLYARAAATSQSFTAEPEKTRLKALRYAIRMATRCTPFGMLAGVGFAEWSRSTNIALSTPHLTAKLRPSQDLLSDIVSSLYSNPTVHAELAVRSNPAILYRPSSIVLDDEKDGGRIELALTSKINSVLELAVSGISIGCLVSLLNKEDPNTADRLFELIEQLFTHRFLLPLFPGPLGKEPLEYALQVLSEVGDASRFASLKSLDSICRNWNSGAETPSLALLQTFESEAQQINSAFKSPLHIDSRTTFFEAKLGTSVKREIENAAVTLLKISSTQPEQSQLNVLRDRFVDRYGLHREIPLIEALDPYEGIGPYSPRGLVHPVSNESARGRAGKLLTSIADEAEFAGSRSIDLTPKMVEELSTGTREFPSSIELSFQICALDRESIDRGEFSIVLSLNVGSPEAGRYFGRFAHLMTDAEAASFKTMVDIDRHVTESRSSNPSIVAELVFSPARPRSANVTSRPQSRSFELVLSGTPSDNATQLYTSDLLLGVAEGRFYIKSKSFDKNVILRSSHMLRPNEEPALVQFLHAVSQDGLAQLSGFSWHDAEARSFLPRVRIGRVILRPAEWKLNSSAICSKSCQASGSLSSKLERWRERYNVPRYVCLTTGDNFLTLDLACLDHQLILQQEANSFAKSTPLIMREMLPRLEETWLSKDDGHFRSEFVTALVLDTDSNNQKNSNSSRPSRHVRATEYKRSTKHVGSNWLFTALYGPEDIQDGLLTSSICPFFNALCQAGYATGWFFIRYKDPRSHLRIRICGSPRRLLTTALPAISEWADKLARQRKLWDFSFNSYDREVERYGGFESLDRIERHFCAESRTACELIQKESDQSLAGLARTEITASGLHSLMEAFNIGLPDRMSILRNRLGNAPGQSIKSWGNRIESWRRLVGDRAEADSGALSLQQTLASYSASAARTARSLQRLHQKSAMSCSPVDLIGDLGHMFCNRMLGTDADDETLAFAILYRTYDYLRNRTAR